MVTVHSNTESASRSDLEPDLTGKTNLVDRTFRRLDGGLSTGTAVALVIGWVASVAIMEAIAPPADPDVVLSTWDLSLSLLYTTGIFGAAVGLFARRRFGAVATIAGATAMSLGSVSCWAAGHVGSWILVQFVAGMALAGASIIALNRS